MGGETRFGQAMASSGAPARSQPKLDFYVVRPNGTHVPMIALDEIDPRFRLVDVPTTLNAEDIERWSMGRVGDTIDGPRATYEIVYVGYQQGQAFGVRAQPSIDDTPSVPTSQSGDYDLSSGETSVNSDHGTGSSPLENENGGTVATSTGDVEVCSCPSLPAMHSSIQHRIISSTWRSSTSLLLKIILPRLRMP